MSNILDDLGLDPDTVTWQDLAACKGMELEWFYEDYENDAVHARNADLVCASCPVVAACAAAGKTKKEEGLWGGVYWNGAGKPDRVRNRHKTDEVWKDLEKKTGLKLHK